MKKWSSQWKQFMQLRTEAWKKFGTSTGFEPVTSRCRCDALPTEATDVGSRSIVGSYVSVKEMIVNDIWNKSYMNCGNQMKMKKRSSQWTQFMQLRDLAIPVQCRWSPEFFFQAYKFHYQLLPSVFDTFFYPVSNIHRYNTRLSFRMTYAIPKARANNEIFNIRFQGGKVWNDVISDDIKLLSIKRFKEKFKSILIAKY